MHTLSKAYKNDYICVSANTDYGFYAACEALVIHEWDQDQECCLFGGGVHIPSLTDP